VSADGGDPEKVKRVTIGFNAVSSLAADKVDAATGFWNAEGVALRRRGIPVRIFKVGRYGAPPYPELVLTTTWRLVRRQPALVRSLADATVRGYEFTVNDSTKALDDLLAEVPTLDRDDQRAQLKALLPDLKPAFFDPTVLGAWWRWDFRHGLLKRPLDPEAAFLLDPDALEGA
jgi:putative hydroxymethylpyrimidine transport system substrate-binding protein